MNPFRLDGKNAVVTGGGSGIGKSIAERFAEAGASVCVLDVDLAAAQAAAEKIKSAGGITRPYRCDVADHSGVKRVFDQVVGDGQVDILVNNAGVSHVGTLESTSEADFDRIFRINVKGMYNCMSALIPHMKVHGGVILNMASTAASTGLSDRFAYSMSKGAVFSMTLSVARDYLKQNIRCNCISPARVHTPFVDGYLRENYPAVKPKCSRSFPKHSPLGGWRNRERSPIWRYFCAVTSPPLSPARIIRWTAAFCGCMADRA